MIPRHAVLWIFFEERREFVFRYHHRSGIFGTMNGMWGGSNVTTFGIRQRW